MRTGLTHFTGLAATLLLLLTLIAWVDYGFAEVLLAIPAAVYLRFLIRRHRGYAGGHGRSDVATPGSEGEPADA